MDYKDTEILAKRKGELSEQKDIIDKISPIIITDEILDNIDNEFKKIESEFDSNMEIYRKHLIYLFDILDMEIEELKSAGDFNNVRVINISEEVGEFVKADTVLKDFISKVGVLYNLMPTLYIDFELKDKEFYVV